MNFDKFKLILDGLIEAGRLQPDAKFTIVAAAIDLHAAGQSEVFRLMEQLRKDRLGSVGDKE